MTSTYHGVTPGDAHGKTGYQALAAPDSPLLTDLVSYWRMNEESGTRVDAHGTYNLTDNNTVLYAAGKSGNAASFVTGNNEYLSSAVIGEWSGDLSISLWVKWDSAQTGTTRGIFQIGNAVNDGSPMVLLQKDTNDDIKIYFASAYIGTFTASNGNWYHAVFANRTSDNKVDFYVNNTSVTDGNATRNNNAADNYFGIGMGFNGYFTGEIDEVCVWNRYLSSDEVAALYASGSGLFYPFQV